MVAAPPKRTLSRRARSAVVERFRSFAAAALGGGAWREGTFRLAIGCGVPVVWRISSAACNRNCHRYRSSSVALGFETLRRDPTRRARRQRWQDGASFGIDGFVIKKEGIVAQSEITGRR
jgi:hypothetical protein